MDSLVIEYYPSNGQNETFSVRETHTGVYGKPGGESDLPVALTIDQVLEVVRATLEAA